MSKWRERLKIFLVENLGTEPSITFNSNRDPQLKVIEGSNLRESPRKILDAVGQSGPITKTSSQVFSGEKSQSATVNNPQLELAAGLTVWDLLRTDWPILLEVIRDAQDSEGSITVYLSGGGGEIQPVRLDRTSVLTATLKDLTVRHPDPLEVVVYALKAGRTVLRSRQRRAMIPGRVIA